MATTERDNGVLTVKVQGRVDGTNANEFQEEIRAALEDGDKAVLLDMAELSYISSAGLRSVLMIAKMMEKSNKPFMIHSLSAPIQDVFEISGFDKIINISDSPEQALKQLKA